MPGRERLSGIDFDRRAENRVGARNAEAVSGYFHGIDLDKPGTHGRPELPYTVTVGRVEETLFDPAGHLAIAESFGIVLAEILTPSKKGKLSRYALHVIYPHYHTIGAAPELEPFTITSRNSGDPTEWLVEIQTSAVHEYGKGNDLTRQDGQRLLEQHGLI